MNAEDREPVIIGGTLQIGALVRFVPAACQVCEAGMTDHVLTEVIGTVTEIHEAHRWYRVAYYMGSDPDCIGNECFKIKNKSKNKRRTS